MLGMRNSSEVQGATKHIMGYINIEEICEKYEEICKKYDRLEMIRNT